MSVRSVRKKKASPKSLNDFVSFLKNTNPFKEALVHHKILSDREAVFTVPAGGLPKWLLTALKANNVEQLFSHQVETIELVRAGNNVVLVTQTASGKSLAFNIPILESLVANSEHRALYLFPLKALEQDQLARLRSLIEAIPEDFDLSTAIYDGDTPTAARAKIRHNIPRILITNPDMLHHGIMPFHTKWETLFRNLRFIVIDELHTYRGVFGSHILQIFRRIRRLAEFYGTSLQFISTSATIENPLELVEALTGASFKLVSRNGSPQKKKHFLFFNPTASPYTDAARLFTECIDAGLKTITFTRSRKITELLFTWCVTSNPRLKKRIAAYRAGFLPQERREIEKKLFSGKLDGVISTSALEMGIDVGGLDACILVGYPGTITATWQRGGRVGREERESLIVMIAAPDALDQYFIAHPEDFFNRSCERAVVDGDNSEILRNHLVCAAAEIPIRLGENSFDTERYRNDLDILVEEKRLDRSINGKLWFPAQANPHHNVNIRSMGVPFTILNSEKKVIGSVSGRQRYAECHPGAIYLHGGTHYFIEKVDESKHLIFASAIKSDYYTIPMSDKETSILSVKQRKKVQNFIVNKGRLRITETITGYQKKRIIGQELLDEMQLNFPPMSFETVGIWIEIEEEIRQYLSFLGRHYMGSIHGIEHAALSLFPLFVLCDRNDVGGICKPLHAQVQKGAIFLYDGHSGGVGLSERAYDVIEELLTKTLELIADCPCEEGCPSCIHSPKCGAGNKPLDKLGSIITLKLLLNHEIDESLLASSSSKLPEIPQINPVFEQIGIIQPQTEVIQKKTSLPFIKKPGQILEIPKITELEKKFRIVTFDLETQRSSHEVGGWGNSHLMRVSVGVVYDSKDDGYFVYTEETIDDLIEHLKKADLVVGFNSINFDYAVLRGYSGFNFSSLPSFDICREVHHSFGKRLSLNQLAKNTLNAGKIADGLLALKWFKEGKMELIEKYCKEDVRLTRDLFRFGLVYNYLLGEEKNSTSPVKIESNWQEKLKKSLK